MSNKGFKQVKFFFKQLLLTEKMPLKKLKKIPKVKNGYIDNTYRN